MNPQGPSFFTQMIPFVFIIALFYFFLFLPQRKQQKKHALMLSALKKGDRVVTASGIIGYIDEVKDTEVKIKIAEQVKITVLKNAIAAVTNEQEVVKH